MKTETQCTGEFMDHVKEVIGTWAVVIKHCDRFTKGIPDLSISSLRNKSVWIESKRLDHVGDSIWYPKHFIKKGDVLQMHTAVRLGAFYLIFDPIKNQAAFFKASTIYHHYRAESIISQTELSENELVVRGPDSTRKVFSHVVQYLQKEL